jgi:hypothetical protein
MSKLRLLDPSLPDPIAPYRWQPGKSANPGGVSAKRKEREMVSTATALGLGLVDERSQQTRAEILARNLLQRAETDSTELERVIHITEPGLLARAGDAPRQNVVIVDTFDDGAHVVKTGSVGNNGHRSGRGIEAGPGSESSG